MAEYLLLQADLSLEVSASLVTQAGRSQPGRAGYVNSQIPKTFTTSTSRDLGVDIPRPVWLPWDDWVTREAEADRPRTPPRCYRNTPDQALSPRSPARRRPAVRSKLSRAPVSQAPSLLPIADNQLQAHF